MTFARGITGIGYAPPLLSLEWELTHSSVGGEYPASSSSASEAANDKFMSRRGPIFISTPSPSKAPLYRSPDLLCDFSGDELRLVLRRSACSIRLPRRSLGGGRGPLVYGLARLLRRREFLYLPPTDSMLLMYFR